MISAAALIYSYVVFNGRIFSNDHDSYTLKKLHTFEKYSLFTAIKNMTQITS